MTLAVHSAFVIPQVTALSIQMFTETKRQSGIFLKKMPPTAPLKRQYMDRKRSGIAVEL
jgi:hypothetical protein